MVKSPELLNSFFPSTHNLTSNQLIIINLIQMVKSPELLNSFFPSTHNLTSNKFVLHLVQMVKSPELLNSFFPSTHIFTSNQCLYLFQMIMSSIISAAFLFIFSPPVSFKFNSTFHLMNQISCPFVNHDSHPDNFSVFDVFRFEYIRPIN